MRSVVILAPVRSALVVVPMLFAAVACSSPTAPTAGAPFSIVDLQVGDGTEAQAGMVVTIDYNAYFYDPRGDGGRGTLFDTSVYGDPLTFVLGANQVISGFDQGVTGMRINGIRRITVPPELGYGSRGSGIIPPNTTLVFDVLLLDAGG